MVAFRSNLVEIIIVGGGTCQGIEWPCHKFHRKFKETSLCRNSENVPKIALNATKLSKIDALDMTTRWLKTTAFTDLRLCSQLT